MDMSDLKIDMNDMIMTDSPIRFPGLFGDWTFTTSSKAIDVGHGVYWYGILIALGLLLALLLCMKERVKYGISEDNLYDGLLWGIPLGIVAPGSTTSCFIWTVSAPPMESLTLAAPSPFGTAAWPFTARSSP